MNFTNVKLILFREIRDQFRDRRTLFMMFVLPILLYPLLGMSFLQVQHFMQEKAVTVWVIGAKRLPERPPLVENQTFAPELFEKPDEADLLKLYFAPDEPPRGGGEIPDKAAARQAVLAGKYDAALYFPEDFARELEQFRQAFEEDPQQVDQFKVPRPEIIFSTAHEKSQIAFARLSRIQDRWTEQVGRTILEAKGVPIAATKPVDFDTVDVADKSAYRGAAWWSKILPVLMLIWAMTGAFYPAVDLCAGEKERGTLETLLCSPAERSEIVLGKLLTIMIFSMITAALNLASVGLTGWLVFGDRPEFVSPPAISLLWLGIALIPVSALFSALCLALAAFARSAKEGQYYLMPLLLITMPLAVLPMAPGVELNLGSSLIPVTGVVLLLRSVLEGNYLPALRFLPVVVAVTLAACLLAIRWAIDQFNSESVLFRESEQLDVGRWLRHLFYDRSPTPTVAAAVFGAVTILLIQFFFSAAIDTPESFAALARLVLSTQLAVIVLPTLLMTLLLTRSPRRTLLLRRPAWMAIPAAGALAVVLHPAVNALQVAVQQLYPINKDMHRHLERIQALIDGAPLWQTLLIIAVTPAICEELAFRGFILSGLRHLGQKWRAIAYSAVFFGLAHMVLQQSLVVCLVGVVIGYLAVQSGSLLPGVIFHLIHNSLAMSINRVPSSVLDRWPLLKTIVAPVEGGYVFPWQTVVLGSLLALLILAWFGRLAYTKSPEEELQEAIHQVQ